MMPAWSLRKKVYLDCEIASPAASSGQAFGDQIRGARPGHVEQPHMRDVEQAGMLAGVQVFLHDAGRIGDRHRPAGERPEAGRCVDVKVFERESF